MVGSAKYLFDHVFSFSTSLKSIFTEISCEMASRKTKTIEEIDDICEMAQAMAALGMSCKGLKTLDDMKSRVKDELHQSAIMPCWTAGQAFSVLSEAKAEDERKRQALLNLYNKAENYLNKLDDKIMSLLQQNMGNVKEKITDNHKAKLEQKEYFLLVAGETGSGKSSLVNLILGEELLPYSVLSTTSTICELKFGKERQIVAHFKDKDPETRLSKKTINLQEGSTDQSYLQQISPYVHVKSEREKGSIFKKIELFWPHSLLEKGVVIIDSPGIGESDIMDRIVTQYLPQAFAFIYTINSANAGGVQKDRLEKLLEEVRGVSLEGLGELPSKCALFVCNKWDQVPEKEAKDVKDHVIRKLQRCWPGLDPQTQIIYMSTMKASKGQNLGFITEDFSTLMDGLKFTVLKSIEARLEIHWKWLDCLLSRIIFQAKAFVMNASRDRERANEKMSQILRRLQTIGKEQKQVMENLNKHLKTRVADAMKQLREHLSSEEVRARFTSWTLDEVPNVESSWQLIENHMEKVLKNRLGDIIEHWEEDEHVFGSSRDSLIQHFQQRYDLVEEQLRDLQGAAVDDSDVPETDPSAWTTTQKVIIGLTGPIWFPLGLVALIIGSPIVGIMAIKRNVEDKRKLEKYREDKCGFMAKQSAEYLDAAKEEKVLKSFVKNQMQEANLCLKQIEARIPELIEADTMLYRQLKNETRSQEEIKDLYQPIMDDGYLLRGHLAVFGIKEVGAMIDISSEELDWRGDSSSLLGYGAFGEVYQGTMKKQEAVSPIHVALKVVRLDAENAALVIAEVELLRKLDHPHIVKFYGTSLLRERSTVRMILVMEKCKRNLTSHIFERPESVPGKTGNDAVVTEVCRWVQQITEALAYIHQEGVVHRNLKLENILIAEDDSVKVTDVGFSKPAVEITGTLAGTPVYIAPEVINSQVYDCKADIYSLGIILWELWYGQRAYHNVKSETLTGLFCLVDDGYRPEHVNGCEQPPARWKQLMEKCWDTNPKQRPTASKCYEEITALSSELCESRLTSITCERLQAASSPLGTSFGPMLG